MKVLYVASEALPFMASAVSRMSFSSILFLKVFQLDQPIGGVRAVPFEYFSSVGKVSLTLLIAFFAISSASFLSGRMFGANFLTAAYAPAATPARAVSLNIDPMNISPFGLKTKIHFCEVVNPAKLWYYLVEQKTFQDCLSIEIYHIYAFCQGKTRRYGGKHEHTETC